jgi:O-antigen ligase
MLLPAALFLIAGFAIDGPYGVLALTSLGVAGVVAAWLLPPAFRVSLLAALGLLVLLPQFARGFYAWEGLPLMLGLLAFFKTIKSPDPRVWDVRWPGWISLAIVLAPLPAFFTAVVSRPSFLALYKVVILWVLFFHALRRLVPRQQSNALLWVFPLVGAAGALQLLWQTRGLGALLFSRLTFRNFYTRLPWGQSDFVSAFLEFCLCMTVVLFLIERRPILRLLLAACAVVMTQGFLLLFSRAGAIGLAAFAVILVVGLGGWRGLYAAAGAALVGVVVLAAEGGQVLLQRFSDPMEYASWFYRILIWQNALGRFASHPWTGIGLNQGRYVNDLQAEESANNFVLDLATEQGILGGIIALVLIFSTYRLSARVTPPGIAGSPHVVRVALCAAVTQLWIHSSVEPTVTGFPMAVMVLYLLAWLCLNDSQSSPSPAPLPATPPA